MQYSCSLETLQKLLKKENTIVFKVYHFNFTYFLGHATPGIPLQISSPAFSSEQVDGLSSHSTLVCQLNSVKHCPIAGQGSPNDLTVPFGHITLSIKIKRIKQIDILISLFKRVFTSFLVFDAAA